MARHVLDRLDTTLGAEWQRRLGACVAERAPQIDAHLEWIGFVRPTGLVVSAPVPRPYA